MTIQPEFIIMYHRQKTARINKAFKDLLPCKILDLKTLKNVLLKIDKENQPVKSGLDLLDSKDKQDYLSILALSGDKENLRQIYADILKNHKLKNSSLSRKESIKLIDKKIKEYQKAQEKGLNYENLKINDTDLYQYQHLNHISQNMRVALSSFYKALFRGDISQKRQTAISKGDIENLLKNQVSLFTKRFMNTL